MLCYVMLCYVMLCYDRWEGRGRGLLYLYTVIQFNAIQFNAKEKDRAMGIL